MGSGKSGLYTGTKGSIKASSLQGNAKAMEKDYPVTVGGYFGNKGKNTRVISSNNPVETSIDFYKRLGKNGKTEGLANGKGTKTTLGDGTVIVHRIITKTKGSPAVEITVSGSPNIKNQKTHFISEE